MLSTNICSIDGFCAFLVLKNLKNCIFAAYFGWNRGHKVGFRTRPLLIFLKCWNQTVHLILTKLCKNSPHSLCLLMFPLKCYSTCIWRHFRHFVFLIVNFVLLLTAIIYVLMVFWSVDMKKHMILLYDCKFQLFW